MKPLDLQVNIMKSIDMNMEKNRGHFLENQFQNSGEALKKEMLNKDNQVTENKKKDEIPKNAPEKENKNSQNSDQSDQDKDSQNSQDQDSAFSDSYQDSHIFDAKA